MPSKADQARQAIDQQRSVDGAVETPATNRAAPEAVPPIASSTASQANADMDRLRDILLGDTAGKLRIVDEFRDPEAFAHKVADVLPHAAGIRAIQDGSLADALAPTIEDALESSIRTNPKPLTDAIFPILGPAIRKAIAHSMQSLMQNVNQAIESTVTPRGIRMRMKAKRMGLSYAELMVAESLVYRVEEVYLIHGETGLLLEHVAALGVETPDTDLVSGMFTAIQDFVRDSFGAGEDAGLAQFRVGDLTVVVERGPQAVIAAVVRGATPSRVRTELQETIERIHAQSRTALEQFEGDPQPFEALRPALQACLTQEHRAPAEPTTSKRVLRRAVPIVLGLGLLTLVGLWIASSVRASALRSRVDAYATALREHPGVRVLAVARDDVPHVAFVHDPAAAADLPSIRATHLRPSDEVTESAVSIALPYPPYVLGRANSRLQPPTDVTLTLADGVLRASGVAPDDWKVRARTRADALVGVERYDDSDVWPVALRSIRAQAADLTKIVMPFGYRDDMFGQPMEAHLGLVQPALDKLERTLEAMPNRPTLDVLVCVVSDSGLANADEEQRLGQLRKRIAVALGRKQFSRLRFKPGPGIAADTIRSGALAADKPVRHVVLQVRAAVLVEPPR